MKRLDTIIEIVRKVFKVDVEKVSRKPKYTNAKYAYYNLAHCFTHYSFSTIGRKVGQEHAMAYYYLEKFAPKNDFDHHMDECYRMAKKMFGEPQKPSVFESNVWLKKRIKNLEDILAERKLEDYRPMPSPMEESLLEIWRELTEEKKEELMFKAKTTLKVQQKMAS